MAATGSPLSSHQPSTNSNNTAASYTPDELAFHKLFPQVPLNEKLVESYQCGLSRKKIVRMGRLYLTSLRLCFHSTFLSDNLMMEWEHVDAVEKKENFVFEAIVVKGSGGDTHYFSAFMYGMTDQAHKMTTMLWNVRRKYAVGGGHAHPGGAAGGGSARTFHGRTESTASTGSIGFPLATVESPDLGPVTDRTSPSAGMTSPIAAVAASHPERTDDAQHVDEEAATTTPPNTSGTPENGSMTFSPRQAEKLTNQSALGTETTQGAPAVPNNSSVGHMPNLSIGSGSDPQPKEETAPSQLTKQDTMPPRPSEESPQLAAVRPGTATPPLEPPKSPVAKPHAVPSATGSAAQVPPPAGKPADRRTEKAIARSTVVVDTPHDVLKYFPHVPKTETVVDSFQCSYVVGVHRLGKLYITANYVLFSSVMLAEGVSLKFSDIVSIEKEQTMVILDGVVMATRQGQTHAFTSFVNRDSAFSILQHFFGAHRTKQSTRDRLKQKQEQENPQSLDSTTVDVASPLNVGNEQQQPAESQPQPAAAPPKKKQTDVNVKTIPSAPPAFRTALVQPSYASLPTADSIDVFSNVSTDFGTGISEVGKFLAKQIIPDVPFPTGASIFDVFKAMFDDETSLLDAYHLQRQDTGTVWEPWRAPLAGSPARSGQRKMTCTTIIRAVMAKQCAFTEFQRFGFFMIHGEPHLLVQFSGQAVGVMFSDSFRAETLLVFSQPSPTEPAVTMRTYGYIQFLRSVWVKNKILSTALDVEMPECYRTLSAMGIAKVKEIPRVTITSDETAEGAQPEPVAQEPQANHVAAPVATPSAPAATFAAPVVAVAPVAPQQEPSPLVKQTQAGLYALALLYVVKALWSTFWFDCESALLSSAASSGVPSMSAAGGDIVQVDLRWVAYIVRPTLMAAQFLLVATLASRIERSLS